MLSTVLGKNFREQQFEIFYLFFPESFLQIVFSLEKICIKSQRLLSGKSKKDVVNLLSAEFAHSAVMVKKLIPIVYA